MTDQEALQLAIEKFGDRVDKPELLGAGTLIVRRGDKELTIQVGGEPRHIVESMIGMMVDAYDESVRREVV